MNSKTAITIIIAIIASLTFLTLVANAGLAPRDELMGELVERMKYEKIRTDKDLARKAKIQQAIDSLSGVSAIGYTKAEVDSLKAILTYDDYFDKATTSSEAGFAGATPLVIGGGVSILALLVLLWKKIWVFIKKHVG